MYSSSSHWFSSVVGAAAALALSTTAAFAAPNAVKISNVANSITFRDGAGHRGNYGFNGGSYSSQMFDGNFTSGVYQNGVGCQLVVSTTHIVTDPNGQPYVTEVKVGHLGNSKYSLYYTTEEEPADILTYAQDPRTWTPIDGAQGVQEAGTKTFNVNQVVTAVMYVFDTAPSWTQAACEFEVWGYEYVPAVAEKISNVGRSITFRDGAGHRGNYGFNGGSYSSQMFDGDFTTGVYQNGVGCQLVVPTTGLDPDTGVDTGVAWYVTEVKVGHVGNSKYSLYYTTDPEPADILTYAQDPRTWTAIDGATNVQEAGTKTYNVNKNATAVMYVFVTAPSWTQAACEFEVWAMDPSSISCLHENFDPATATWTVCTPATCTANAFEEAFCPDCGNRFEREVPLSKLGHDFVATLTTPGTASSYGSGYVECSRCDEFHIEFNGDTVDLTTLGGMPINGVVQYTDLTVSSTGAQDGGIKPSYMMDGYWDNGWGHAWYAGTCSSNEWVQYAFGTTIELTKIEYSVINESQTVYFSKYDPETGEETLLKTIPIVKDTTEGAPGYQRKTLFFFVDGETDSVWVDAIRMRIGDYINPDTGEVTRYTGYNYGAHDRHTIVCEIHPWGTIAGAGMVQPSAMIGNTGYATLADAIAAATNGVVVTLMEDVAEPGVIIGTTDLVSRAFTIDLGGFSWTLTDTPLVASNTVVTLRNGTVSTAVADAFQARGNAASLTLGDHLTVNGSSSIAYAYDGGAVTNAGATIACTSAASVVARADGAGSTIAISSGTVTYIATPAFRASNGGSIAISGGYFTTVVPAEFCAPHYYPVEEPNERTGLYTVKAAWIVTFVTKWGETPEAQKLYVEGGNAVYATAPDYAPFTGSDLLGWFAPGSEDAFDFENTPITADITLKARWFGTLIQVGGSVAPAP